MKTLKRNKTLIKAISFSHKQSICTHKYLFFNRFDRCKNRSTAVSISTINRQHFILNTSLLFESTLRWSICLQNNCLFKWKYYLVSTIHQLHSHLKHINCTYNLLPYTADKPMNIYFVFIVRVDSIFKLPLATCFLLLIYRRILKKAWTKQQRSSNNLQTDSKYLIELYLEIL